MRKIVSLMALFVISLLSLSMVSALDATNLSWGSVRVNGDYVNDGEVLAVEEGQTIDIRVGLLAAAGADNIEVDAKIAGYEYSDEEPLSDSTGLFDVQANQTKYKDLQITLPTHLDKDRYTLRLRAMDKNTAALVHTVELSIEPVRHGIGITDVTFSPGSTVKAGRSLLTTVLVENFGDRDQEDVKVTVEIPTLGLTAAEFIDVETDNHNVDYEDVPQVFLPIPATAAEGDYQVVVTAKYNNLRDTVSKTFTVHVAQDERFQEEGSVVLAVGPESQSVVAGKTATYALALSNTGRTSKAYVLETMAGDWATVTLSDSVVVLESGKNKVVYVEVTPKAGATAGEHVTSVNIKSGDGELVQSVPLRASVVAESASVSATASTDFSLRNGLEIALIVLVVVLVIVGLIVGFSRLRKDDEEDQKTYY